MVKISKKSKNPKYWSNSNIRVNFVSAKINNPVNTYS
jgi:hypothetical protein